MNGTTIGAALLALGGPLAAFLLLAILPPLRRSGRPAALVSIGGILLSAGAACVLLARVLAGAEPASAVWRWTPLERIPPIHVGVLVDGLSAAMLVVVAVVAMLVQVYSLAYLHGERRPALGRYYAWQSLFAFSMMGLVLAPDLLQTYMFWELVGVCSFLLIGFWYEKPSAARAALKAFWTTRLGDVGFAIGVVVLAIAGGSFAYTELFARAGTGALAGTALTIGVAGLFVGAMGKSAQFPLHIWLPDAMEGPTPVSALIHAATMVAAGVYLMVRVSPLLEAAPEVAAWVLGLGALTALVGGSIALVERDIKRVLAWSTVSQLGLMMAAVGAGAPLASFFHLVTHASFKALLFLAAGSVIHAVGTQDLFTMGGLLRKLPWPGALFLIGTLALAGVPPLAGFFSKDAVLLGVWSGGHPVAFAALVATSFLTAFYMARAFVLAFLGAPRTEVHPHESPPTMLVPMLVLAIGAVTLGWAGGGLDALLERSISFAGRTVPHLEHVVWVPFLATGVVLGGLALGWAGYAGGLYAPARVAAALAPVTRFLERGWYVDDVALGAYRVGIVALSALVGWIDRYVIDGIVNALTVATARSSDALRHVQNGRVQDALYAVGVGVLVLVILAIGW